MARDCDLEIALEISKHVPDVGLDRINAYIKAVTDTFAESAQELGIPLDSMNAKQMMTLLSSQDRKAVLDLTHDKLGMRAAESLLSVVRTQEAASRAMLDITSQLVHAASRDNLTTKPGQLAEVGKLNAVKAFREYILNRGAKLIDRNMKLFASPVMAVIDSDPALNALLKAMPGTADHDAYTRITEQALAHMFDHKLTKPGFKAETTAARLALAIRQGYDGSIALLNDLGLNIKQSDVYVPNHHDPVRMLDHGEEAWIASVMKNIDRDRSPIMKALQPAKGQTVDDALRARLVEIYRGWTDRFEAGKAPDAEQGTYSSVTDTSHMKFELSRDIVFAGPDAWLDYHATFGKTMDVLHGFTAAIGQRARAASMFELFGPRPVMGAQMVKSELMAALQRAVDKADDGFILDIPTAAHDLARLREFNPEPGQRLQAVKAEDLISPSDGGLTMALAEIGGDTFSTKNKSVSDVMATIRTVKSWASLGSAAIPALVVDPQNIVMSMLTKGMGYKSALASVLSETAAHAQYRHGAMRKMLGAVGADVSQMEGALDHFPLIAGAFEGLMADMHNAAHADNPMSITKLNGYYYRMNGLTPVTDMGRGVAWRTNMEWLGQNAHKPFDALPARLQYSLAYQQIGRAQWEAMRRAIVEFPNGKIYVVPEMLHTIDLETLRTALQLDDAPKHLPADVAALGKATELRWRADPEAFRRDTLRNLVGFLADETKQAIVEGDAKTRYTLLRGTNPGTVGGEALRMLAMFRSYSTGVVGSVMRQARNLPPGDNIGWDAGKWVAGSIVMGYVSQWLLDLSQGYAPRSIVGEHAGRSFMGAFKKSSFLGPYGDALLNIMDGPKSRPWVVNAINAAGGPMVSTTTDAIGLVYKGVQAEQGWANDAFRFMLQNTPGQNIWWARAALDVSVVRNVEHMLDAPARHARIMYNEQKVGREFLLPE